MRFMSVASGISAETLAWSPLGFEAMSYAQFDPDHNYKRGPDFASAVLAHHYPNTPNYGDMEKFEEWPDHAALDVLAGGTPCQTFSFAGLGAGLDDARGNLAANNGRKLGRLSCRPTGTRANRAFSVSCNASGKGPTRP